LVVIIVVGILSSFIIVGMSSITNNANIAKSKAFSDSLKNSLMMNLVSEWKFDLGTTGNTVLASEVIDSWSNKNASLVSSDPVVRDGSDCFDEKCLEFDSNDYVQFSSYNINIDEITVEFWMKDLGSTILWYDYLGIHVDATTRICFELSSVSPKRFLPVTRLNNVNYDGSVMDIGVGFNHYAISFSKTGNYRKTYNNGRLIESKVGWPGGYTVSYVRLGDVLASIFVLDTTRIYDSSLSSFKIENNYYSDLSRFLIKGRITNQEYLYKLSEL